MVASSVALRFSTLSSRHQQYLDSLVPPSREEFERIARAQDEKEEQIRRRLREQRRCACGLERRREANRPRNAQASQDELERARAARVVEENYRGVRAMRGVDGFAPDPTTRWIAAIKELRFRKATRPRLARLEEVTTGSSLSSSGSQDTASTVDANADALRRSAARLNWKKIGMIARRAGHDDSDDEESDEDEDNLFDAGSTSSGSRRRGRSPRDAREEANAQRRQTALTLGLQYWLEIIDAKHRYGTNLRMYHEEWRKASTGDNFFTWLDHGDGRFISLQTCSRERLERDQVRYLSREERGYYLATVDGQGRICWARTGEPITTSDRFKDSAYGIVPADDDTTPAYERPKTRGSKKNNDKIIIDDDDDDLGLFAVAKQEDGRLGGAVNPVRSPSASLPAADDDDDDDDDPQRPVKKVFQFSATSTFDKLLRKFVKDGTWIFVADTSFRLYVGIKQAGAFQHSSFLQGGRISAGGLIEIRDGRLTSLSPLSGHYRPPTSNFRAFVRSLEAEGVDVTGVPDLKSFAVLYGLETYVKARKKGRGLVQMVRGSAKGGERRERQPSESHR